MRCCRAPTPHDEWKAAGYGAGSFQTRVCALCRSPLSLGPAADDSEQVKVEIRAAEIIAGVMTNIEITDWQIAIGMAAHDADNDPPTGGLAWMWHAGWLARAMWRHHAAGEG